MTDIREILEREARQARPSPEGLERTLGRVRRRQRNRRIVAGVTAAVVAVGGIALAYTTIRPQLSPPAEGSRRIECLSPDEPDLLTCREAVRRADQEEGRETTEVEARLDQYLRWPGANEIRVWIVSYNDVEIHGHRGCFIGDWEVAIDATTGEFLVAGISGQGEGQACATPSGGPGSWSVVPGSPLDSRTNAAAVWTGNEMLVWGGSARERSEKFGTGASYDPESGAWSLLPGAPVEPRDGHTAVWTGREMVVWGGSGSSGLLADGAAYDPASGRWRLLPEAPLSARDSHAGVWTGAEMLIWGGGGEEGYLSDGAAYDPATDRWRTLASSPLEGRISAVTVWDGGRMITWGGYGHQRRFDDGAMLDPTIGSWRVLPSSPLPQACDSLLGEWSSREVLIVCRPRGESISVGAAYDPVADRWRSLPTLQSGIGPFAPVWTGDALLVWSGGGDFGQRAGAFSYEPEPDEWIELPPPPFEDGFPDVSVWTGTEAIFWGGEGPVASVAFQPRSDR